MRVLLLGRNGQVGWELQRSLSSIGQLISLDARSTEYCGDLFDLAGLSATINRIRPHVIVNAAAYTAVDKAESEPQRAKSVNSDAPKIIAEQAKLLGIFFVHFSTDYVFAGETNKPRNECEEANPLNVYGATKLAGEDAIRASGCRHVILRTSWVHSARGHNFIKTILRLAQEKSEIEIVNDQFGAPTGADLIADVCSHVIRSVYDKPDLDGLYHIAASGETSWYQYARHIIDHLETNAQHIRLKLNTLAPIAATDYLSAAVRPKNSRLDTRKLQTTFGLTLPDWRVGVDRALTEILERL